MKLFLANVSRRPSLFWIIYMSGFIVKYTLANIEVSWPWLVSQCLADLSMAACHSRRGTWESGLRSTRVALPARWPSASEQYLPLT